jgi:predicted transcriptional regulator
MYLTFNPMNTRKLEGDEAVQTIVDILKEADTPLTTRQVQEETQKRMVRCPDTTIVFLNRLRQKGVIKGERNKEARGWIWWVD